jgi:hypothetical protein
MPVRLGGEVRYLWLAMALLFVRARLTPSGVLIREKICRGRRSGWRLGDPGLRFSDRLQRLVVFSLQLGQLADVMPFAGVENEEETGERRERRKPRTKHAREE